MKPVDLTYSGRHGIEHSGFAADDDEALSIARRLYSGSEWKPETISVRLTSREVGHVYRTRKEFEDAYQAEIAEGWVTPIQVYGGWKGQAEYYEISAEENE